MSFRPKDDETRGRVRTEHKTSFVLEAGAGTGKTTLLVDRIESMVRRGTAPLDAIAAVTFTENAATTMKLRLRERLERARSDEAAPQAERARSAAALEILERAQISTIHALCATILQERPLECGVAPGFRVADESETDLLFAESWEEWLAEHLIQGDEVLIEAMDAGIPLEGETSLGERTSLRGLARTLVEQRDLEPLVGECLVDPADWRRELLEKTASGAALLALAQPGDTLAGRLTLLLRFAEESRALRGPALKAHLLKLPTIPRNLGHKPRWPSPEVLAEARAIAEWTKKASQDWGARSSTALHARSVTALKGVGEIYERKKTEKGLLDFLDLLLKARDALRDRESLRRYFRERFRALIIDEFQDTDPVQVQIAALLAGEVAGGLVVVGDAKQSIYRFRRAEVALFRRLSEEARGKRGSAVLHLTQNFRSRPSILRFVNRVFSELILASEEAGQPAYEPIDARPGLPEEPSVIALQFSAPFAQGEDLLREESAAVAAFMAEVSKGRYELRDLLTDAPRPSRAGDILVLARRLTYMRHLEEALEAVGLRFTVEGGKSFFDRQEVHEALSVIRAIEDPSDRVSLVAALRSSFFGVSDRDIVGYSLAGGALWLGRVDPEKTGASAIGPALALLGELHRLRTRNSTPALLEMLYDETRILSALTGTRRGEAQIANLEKVVALAREASDLSVLTLRGFAHLLRERIDTAREEPDLPSTRPGDPTTIRILSIHKAKGLEAPFVVLHDTADDFRSRADTIPLWSEGKIAVGFRSGCQPPGWDVLTSREEARAWAEGRRLLYVACTRARDFLVIPRPSSNARIGSFWKDLIARLPAAPDADVQFVDAETLRRPTPDEQRADFRPLAMAEGGDAFAGRWDAERAALVGAASERPFLPISAVRAAARKAPPPAFTPGGFGGRDFGSLVHKLLEWIPLHEVARAALMAEALAPSFGLDAEGAREAAEAAAKVLRLPIMDRARKATRVFRELPLSFPEGRELVEGVIDLVFEEDGELVLLDYKTDQLTKEQALAQAAHHAPQLQLYGRGLAIATGLRVKERLVVFTSLGEAVPV
jgi:ATP-dependent helicase/nuclease subunit A